MRSALIVVLFLVAVSCLQKKSGSGDSDVFMPSRRLAELTEKKLGEVSGLAMSSANPGFFWAHNDSGNPAIVYLVDESLKIRMSCRLKGVKNRDWEDITVGPGPDDNKRYVYVADIGDNNSKYRFKHIYRFEEPVVTNVNKEITITAFDTITFKLEDGKKDMETIMVHPVTKNIYFVSKREKPVFVYELKYPFAKDTLTAMKIASLPLTQIVAGDFSPDGSEVLLKNYDFIYYWNLEGKSLIEGLKKKPEIVNYTEEPQGEAISFNLDGSGFYTLSEKIGGEKTYLYYYARNQR
jgi:hypothetical protein